MPKKSIPQLKDKFQKGDKPMQEDFYDLLDSFIHRDEDISKILIKIASISEAENGSDNVKHMTPLLTKKAIYALTRLADIPDLATEVQQKIDASINSLLTLEDADNLINTVKDVLDFVQGAGEDLNIITELNKARTGAASDVRGGVSNAYNTLKKLYDWAVGLFDSKIDKSAMSNLNSSTSTTHVATSKAVYDAQVYARNGAVNLVRGVGVDSDKDTLKKLYDHFKNYYNSNNANRNDVDWNARGLNVSSRVRQYFSGVGGEKATLRTFREAYSSSIGWEEFAADKLCYSTGVSPTTPKITLDLKHGAADFSGKVEVEDLIIK